MFESMKFRLDEATLARWLDNFVTSPTLHREASGAS